MDFETKWDVVSSVFSISIFAMSIIGPLAIGFVLYKKFPYLNRTRIRRKWGVLYEEIKLSQGRSVILHIVYFYIRRLGLGLALVT